MGETTSDIHLNDRAFWRIVPAAIWRYKLGGYQVLKKWLSYRERTILGRPLSPEEVQHFTDTARQIARVLALISVSDPVTDTVSARSGFDTPTHLDRQSYFFGGGAGGGFGLTTGFCFRDTPSASLTFLTFFVGGGVGSFAMT